jgi:HSP20 family protein
MFYKFSNLDKLIDGLLIDYRPNNLNKINWSLDEDIIYSKDGAYLTLEVPGFNKSNLKVEKEGSSIFIEGTRTYKSDGEEKQKRISRKFNVGQEYNSESIEATIEDGILTIFIPNYKKEEKKRISLL